MADSFVAKLITELTAKTTAADTDLVPVADSNGNFFKMTFAKLKELITSELNTKKANNQDGHVCTIGVTAIGSTSISNINVDGKKFDLIPNNRDQYDNVKILDMKVIYTTNPWTIETKIYIDGRVYTKTITLS